MKPIVLALYTHHAHTRCMRAQMTGAFHLGSNPMTVCERKGGVHFTWEAIKCVYVNAKEGCISLGKSCNDLGRLNQPPSRTAKDARWARPTNDAAMIYTSCVAHDIK